MQVNIDDVMMILAQKEVEIFVLRKQIMALTAELKQWPIVVDKPEAAAETKGT